MQAHKKHKNQLLIGLSYYLFTVHFNTPNKDLLENKLYETDPYMSHSVI